ncbi:hypothetical protein BCR43DRAFT_265050 [Syncephalastrum racemosum]|uniref:C2H2-type domain-containing protein n=1 Tax=Syncephalastrum racemosum TaxID=13706 RepID=A0A1X2HH35_SYNRA|nr:hypothetical protein BCR43DRAFT_265050 [Syncephalastrum racemosum]
MILWLLPYPVWINQSVNPIMILLAGSVVRFAFQPMARGAQKEQARQKAQKEAAKRNAGGKSQLGARAAGLQIKCPKCFTAIPTYKLLVQHMEAKHPKETVPPESSFTA